MSAPVDILGLIAGARTSLLMRGHSPVRVLIGPALLARLQRDAGLDRLKRDAMLPYAPYEGQILGMPYEVSESVEGFVVLGSPAAGGIF